MSEADLSLRYYQYNYYGQADWRVLRRMGVILHPIAGTPAPDCYLTDAQLGG